MAEKSKILNLKHYFTFIEKKRFWSFNDLYQRKRSHFFNKKTFQVLVFELLQKIIFMWSLWWTFYMKVWNIDLKILNLKELLQMYFSSFFTSFGLGLATRCILRSIYILQETFCDLNELFIQNCMQWSNVYST